MDEDQTGNKLGLCVFGRALTTECKNCASVMSINDDNCPWCNSSFSSYSHSSQKIIKPIPKAAAAYLRTTKNQMTTMITTASSSSTDEDSKMVPELANYKETASQYVADLLKSSSN